MKSLLFPGKRNENLFRDDNVIGFLEDLVTPLGAASYMAFFQVAFDGSGTFDQHAAIAYAGAVATTKQWSAFTESWSAVLERERLRYFKMAEAMKWYGEFTAKYSEWGDEREARRQVLLDDLTDVAIHYDFKATGMWTDARVLASQARIPDKKVELFQGAILTLLQAVPDGNYVTLMFDEELDIEDKIRAWIRQLRVKRKDTVAPITGICFMDDRVIPPIQLADMVAWLYRAFGEQVIASDGRNVSMNPLLTKVMHASHFTVHKTAPGQLLDGLRHYGDPSS